MKSGSLHFLEPPGPIQVCNAIDLPSIVIDVLLYLFPRIRPLLGIMPMRLHCEPRPVSRASLAVGFDAGRTGQCTNKHDLCVSNAVFIYPLTLCKMLTSAVNFMLYFLC